MFESLEPLRALLVQHSAQHGSSGHPPEIRRQVMEAAWALHVRGARWRDIGATLGLPRSTVYRWAQEWSDEFGAPQAEQVFETPASPDVPVFLPVQVTPPSRGMASTAPCLITPAGHRVEGLDLNALTVLLERLG